MALLNISLTDVYTAFQVYPAWVHMLETVGRLPKHPRRRVTREWLQSLATLVLELKGELPGAAKSLLQKHGLRDYLPCPNPFEP